MSHANYHEVAGADPAACGRQLGRLFGAKVREYIEDEEDTRHWRRLKAEADRYLAVTAKYFPAYIEELQAYADAARVDLLDLWTMSIGDELDDAEKCTTVVTNNGRLIAHNEDWDADAVEDICILKRTCGGITTLELYYYGCPLGGTALSICSRGYVQAINSLNHVDQRVGIPKIVIARRLSELADAGRELSDLLALPRASGFAHTLVDRSGRTTAVECSAKRQSVHHPKLPFVHTNHMLDAALSNVQGELDGRSTIERYNAACSLAAPTMDRAALTKLTGDNGRGPVNSVLNENTIARAIVDLDRRVASFWLRREARKGWVDYPIEFMFAGDARAIS
jgi:predicted choloylglycine hydrolase